MTNQEVDKYIYAFSFIETIGTLCLCHGIKIIDFYRPTNGSVDLIVGREDLDMVLTIYLALIAIVGTRNMKTGREIVFFLSLGS
jgi:hypothetical protein